jgi:hypothetical protein
VAKVWKAPYFYTTELIENLVVRTAQFSRATFLKGHRYEAFIHLIKFEELI